MGYEEIKNIRNVQIMNQSAGWFPGKEHNDIPGNLEDPLSPIGFYDVDGWIWFEGALRKLFGYAHIQAAALNGGATIGSLYYSTIFDDVYGNAGNTIYSGMNVAAPTDITSGLTISATNQIQWDQWQFEATRYVIGVDKANAPFKEDGGGAATLLAGAPSGGWWVKIWQDACWIARTASEPSTLYFSALADPETWPTDYAYNFDAPITGLGVLGDFMVVFKERSIGILSGDSNTALTKVNTFIDGIGCSGGHTIQNVRVNGQEVLLFHANDGFYIFDGTQKLIKVSNPIQRKYIASTLNQRWNKNRFDNAYSTYVSTYGWYICALTDGGGTENDTLVYIDCSRLMKGNDGLFLPHWRFSDVDANAIATDGDNNILIGSTSGYVDQFNESTFQKNGSNYDTYAKSKIFDMVYSWILLEPNIMGDTQATTVRLYVNADLESGDGEYADFDLSDVDEVLAPAGVGYSDFILDSSVLGGKDFSFVHSDISNNGRFIEYMCENNANQAANIEEINFILQLTGHETNVVT